ncbi:haloacid dehalogenase type II [Microbacterium sp.]|uniref:haloacid dehalogenase type II n=1 Tax=Microbacterium sp. TaxID=51671 RepID=UPI003F969F32
MSLPSLDTEVDVEVDFDVIVFDVLGTLVDQPAGLRAAIATAVPGADPQVVDALADRWQRHVEDRQLEMAEGSRPYAGSDVLDAEAAAVILEEVSSRGLAVDPVAVGQLATASERLPPWPDSVAELRRIGQRTPVLALSNAAPATLLRLAANSGLRWHEAVSADAVNAYKPAPALYRRAIEVAGRPADRVLMVAAHAWDLRAAQSAGMRTCYVVRPVGDPPNASDSFDARARGLSALR